MDATPQRPHSQSSPPSCSGAPGEDGFRIWPPDALNSETLITCLEKLWQIRPKFATMLDNAACHESGMAEIFMEYTGGAVKLVYLPPYAP